MIDCAKVNSSSVLRKPLMYKPSKNICIMCGKPEEKIIPKQSKLFKNKFPENKILYQNFTAGDFLKIIKWVSDTITDDYDLSKIRLEKYIHKDTKEFLYMVAEIPLKTRDGNYTTFGMEIKIHSDGYVSYENGNGVKFKFENPLEVYNLILEKFK